MKKIFFAALVAVFLAGCQSTNQAPVEDKSGEASAGTQSGATTSGTQSGAVSGSQTA